jgi:hypothetical protein
MRTIEKQRNCPPGQRAGNEAINKLRYFARGVIGWAASLVELLMTSQVQAVGAQASLLTNNRSHRINPATGRGRFGLKAENVPDLIDWGAATRSNDNTSTLVQHWHSYLLCGDLFMLCLCGIQDRLVRPASIRVTTEACQYWNPDDRVFHAYYDVLSLTTHERRIWTAGLADRLSAAYYNNRSLRPWLDRQHIDPGALAANSKLTTALDRSLVLGLVLIGSEFRCEDSRSEHIGGRRGLGLIGPSPTWLICPVARPDACAPDSWMPSRVAPGSVYKGWLKSQSEGFVDGGEQAALDPFRGYANAIREGLPDAVAVLDASMSSDSAPRWSTRCGGVCNKTR